MSVQPKGNPHPRAHGSHLKGFQLAAVERAFERLYGASDSTRRFLIADEVGLGKTIIARGIIERAISHLTNQGVKRIDIIYICSNQQIARQNLLRLTPPGLQVTAKSDRITLLPLSVHDLRNRPLNFIALTPGTSFDMRSSLGIMQERLLLHAMCTACWDLPATGSLNLFQGNASTDRFRHAAKTFRSDFPISSSIEREFHNQLRSASHGSQSMESCLRQMCERFSRARETLPLEDKEDRTALIAALRLLLARTCIDELSPDLVILDEFQRFKALLDHSSPTGDLADGLFAFARGHEEARVLLLSATPYKMYTLSHERREDDHYEDFLRTVDFLNPNKPAQEAFRSLLRAWRQKLFELGGDQDAGSLDQLRALKGSIETTLRRVMSRTERVAASADRSGMLREVSLDALDLQPQDAVACARLQAIAAELEAPPVMEYWKSTPFPLNFMEDYVLKKRLLRRLELTGVQGKKALSEHIQAAQPALLDWKAVERYESVDPRNPALRALVADLDRTGAFGALWIPPTLPYWKPEGPFKEMREQGFTKRLVFSAWNVVPKAIATLVSYEAERRLFRAIDDAARNTPTARKARSALLRFSRSDGRLTGMPVLALVYASPALARFGDVLPMLSDCTPGDSSEEVLARVEANLAPFLEEVTREWGEAAGPKDQPDESWYWAGPVLLDVALEGETAVRFWQRSSLANDWTSADADEASSQEASEEGSEIPESPFQSEGGAAIDEPEPRWNDHLKEVKKLLRGELRLGPPPHDLARVLACIALGGPATCALRAMQRALGVSDANRDGALHLAACRVGWAFRSYLNRPESMAAVRRGRLEAPYWRCVLEYSLQGCLTAAIDEWAHILREATGLLDAEAEEGPARIARAMIEAVSMRIASHDVDVLGVSGDAVTRAAHTMRAHFAQRFSSDRKDDTSQIERESHVRAAFNSPFWPFVLATTSVGQEGLDFHQFCHAVLHWNLPRNPVDMEQREGRVHRYKNHAIRRNVAARYGDASVRSLPVGKSPVDPWERAFMAAAADAPPGERGLMPYWVYEVSGQPAPAMVERHLAYLPLSREALHFKELKRSLAAYRLVFGQPRQDDLLEFLQGRLRDSELESLSEALKVDLSPGGVAKS